MRGIKSKPWKGNQPRIRVLLGDEKGFLLAWPLVLPEIRFLCSSAGLQGPAFREVTGTNWKEIQEKSSPVKSAERPESEAQQVVSPGIPTGYCLSVSPWS